MTYKEAKRILHPDTTREALAEIEFLGGFKGKEKLREAVDEACLMACKALDKQIPKKPHILHYAPCAPDWEEDWDYACPSCGSEEIYYHDHHCACGQAIDWSDDNGGT